MPFSEEQLAEIKKYASISGMEVEEFIKSVCLTHCLQQMECLYGEKSEASEAAGGAEKPESGIEVARKVEFKGQKLGSISKELPASTSKDLLDGPLVLDQQCIMDLFAIKREFGNLSNNEIITIALKLGLNQLDIALGLLKNKLKE
ncbi:hypothetical protein [Methanosarcina sp. UBA5]|uniref:hypothetical protein n=1 Tax=Methanosarcina sp. UBA5 TaxID=1915593 RepID=UPI0025FCB2D6|nr:hypothetical protein [Methanosarcina sp. UBA5]